MLTKRYILIFALVGLIFSCQKENIQPSVTAKSVSGTDDYPVWRTANSNGNNSSTSLKSEEILNDKVDIDLLRDNDDDLITDPNNDDDRNKKKKN